MASVNLSSSLGSCQACNSLSQGNATSSNYAAAALHKSDAEMNLEGCGRENAVQCESIQITL